MQIRKIFVPNIFFYKIIQIYLDLFAKNMNGWSGNSEIWCAEQLGRAEEKTRKHKFYLGSRSWCKYFPNIFTTIFIWKYFLKIFGAWPWVFNAPFNSSPNLPLLSEEDAWHLRLIMQLVKLSWNIYWKWNWTKKSTQIFCLK